MLLDPCRRTEIFVKIPEIQLFLTPYDRKQFVTGSELDHIRYFQLQQFLELLMFPFRGTHWASNFNKNCLITNIKQEHYHYFRTYLNIISRLSPEYEHNRKVLVFSECVHDLLKKRVSPQDQDFFLTPDKLIPFGHPLLKQIFKILCERLITRLSPYKNEDINRSSYVQRQSRAYMRYAQKIIENNPGVNLINLKLAYLRNSDATTKTAKTDFKHLLENERRNNFFRNKIGYIAKLDWSSFFGLHWDVLYFFRRVAPWENNGIFLEETIGTYWMQEVTRGRGFFYKSKLRERYFNVLLYSTPSESPLNQQNAASLKVVFEIVTKMCESSLYFVPKCIQEEPRLLRRGNIIL